MIPMPHKHNADRRHHIPKMAFKVQNWPAYEAGLRRRGSLTLWIEDAALECWQTLGPGGQARYTDVAIQTSLMLRNAFKLALRQTEGLITSVLALMGLMLSAPDHSTVSRRSVTLPVIQPVSAPQGPLHVLIDSTGLQVYGAGQWLEAKHGAKSRRTWRKLPLAVDAASGMIVAQTLTDQDADDPSQVGPLLDQIDDPIGQVTADGALVRSATGGPVAHILDWFHLSMRVHHVEQVMEGLCALKPPLLVPLDQAWIDVERLRHLLWNGHHEKGCEALGRIASWAKDASVLNEPAMEAGTRRLVARCTELRAYIETNKGALIDYGQRHRAGKPISTSRAEGTVNQLVSARMNKRQQMRWSPKGAHRVLQVRAAVLDGRFGHPAIQLAV
jgi:hypothetical protein